MRLSIATLLLCLSLFTSSACGPAPEDACQECHVPALSTREDNLPPCDPESGCPGGEEPPPPTQSVRVDVSYENRATSAITTYAAIAADHPTFISAWSETRQHPALTSTFLAGVATGEIGNLITFSITDLSGGPTLTTTITPRTTRVHCRAQLVGSGGMGLSCSDG